MMTNGDKMALKGSFKELMRKRIASDPAFGGALLREGIDTMLAGRFQHRQGDPARLHQGDRHARAGVTRESKRAIMHYFLIRTT
jgi:hypothetical protein